MLEREKKRLAEYKRAYQVKAFPMLGNESKMIGVSAIDGAILADIQGSCHLAGAILVGEAIVVGNPGRGAGYNSLQSYVKWVCGKYKNGLPGCWCFAFVISEDETVDLVAANSDS